MASYELTLAAERDLTDIYHYTYAEFGQPQADRYFESLEDCITRLAVNPRLGRDVSGLGEGYRRFIHQRHAIFCRRRRGGILVVRILGPGKSADAVF